MRNPHLDPQDRVFGHEFAEADHIRVAGDVAWDIHPVFTQEHRRDALTAGILPELNDLSGVDPARDEPDEEA